MYICSGWLSLEEAEDDDDVKVLRAKRQELATLMAKWEGDPRGRLAQELNYAHFLLLWECHNRAGNSTERIIAFLERVCKIYTESMGVVTIYDDEALTDQAMMYVVQRGRGTLEPWPSFRPDAGR